MYMSETVYSLLLVLVVNSSSSYVAFVGVVLCRSSFKLASRASSARRDRLDSYKLINMLES